jgi:hypothetical protein
MADRLSKGQEIGSMFETTPAKGEYQLYLEAKKEREAAEADKAAKAKAAAAQAAADGVKPGIERDRRSVIAANALTHPCLQP